MAGEKRTIEDMIADKGYPPEVADAILAEVDKHKTAERIISGELTLPSAYDAIRHHTGEAAREEALRQERRR